MDKLTFIAWIAHAFWWGYAHGARQKPSQLMPTEEDLKSSINGIQFFLDNPKANASDLHNNWWAYKKENGWHWGPIKNELTKEHPDMIPWDQLPREEKAKDFNFFAAVQYGLRLWGLLRGGE